MIQILTNLNKYILIMNKILNKLIYKKIKLSQMIMIFKMKYYNYDYILLDKYYLDLGGINFGET